jgi:hypothetical protein
MGLIWLASIVSAGAWAYAQVIVQRPDIQNLPAGPPPPLFAPGQPLVISGSNIAFRATDMRGDTLVGTWVVRTSATAPWRETASSR